MALAFQSGDSVKQALFEELQNLLNADKGIRTNAEGRIKQLEFTEGTTIITSTSSLMKIKSSASIEFIHSCFKYTFRLWRISR